MSSPKEVVAYLPHGGKVMLDLTQHQKTLTARWFNPADGTFSEAFRVEGGGERQLHAPTNHDWAVHLREGGSEP